MDNKNNNQEQQIPQDGKGRTFNRGPQADEHHNSESGRADISSIDQQEGLMHHGEAGGGGHFAPQSGQQEQEQKS